MRFIIRWVLSAVALWAIANYLVTGIRISNFGAALIAIAVLGLVNALIRPVIFILTLPFNILTLGLFTLVVNALMFYLASRFVPGFSVSGFWPAFWGALLMWAANWFINGLLRDRS